MLPNPPPMSGEMTWILCSGILEISDATVRMTCGAWKVPQTVSSPRTLSKRGDALAGFQRRGMHALIGDQLLDRDFGVGEGGVGCAFVADLPGEHMVVVLARAMRALVLSLMSSRSTGASAAIALNGSMTTGSAS